MRARSAYKSGIKGVIGFERFKIMVGVFLFLLAVGFVWWVIRSIAVGWHKGSEACASVLALALAVVFLPLGYALGMVAMGVITGAEPWLPAGAAGEYLAALFVGWVVRDPQRHPARRAQPSRS